MIPSRRELLQLGMGATAIACGSSAPDFVAESAAAVQDSKSPDRILVVVELDGGNDGLNTVVPYGDHVYQASRPTIRIPADRVLKIDDRIGLHPNLRPFSEMLDNHQLAIIQGVGYPNPNRSHFQSMSIWHTGDRSATLASPGWLSRFVDDNSHPSQMDSIALHVDDAVLPQALTGSDFQVPSANQIEQLKRRIGVPAAAGRAEQLAALDRVVATPRGAAGSHLQFIQQNSVLSFASSARLSTLLRQVGKPDASFPNEAIGRRLGMISQLIRADLGTVIYYTRLGGFDTHSNQRFQHANLLDQLSNSIKAFFVDLTKAGIADRVLLFAFSEFGRRLKENGSQGTDHGTAGPVFVAGPAVRAGLHGPHPNLTDLVGGDPKYAIDFRDIYAEILSNWLNCEHHFEVAKESVSVIR